MIRKAPLVAAMISSVLFGSTAMGQSGRDYITVVGSSTVYPFTTTVAEQFGKAGKFKTPKVESTGTGGGIKLFCGGVGVQHPDIANASRAIKAGEVESCTKAGVKDIVELKVGYDGIVVASSNKGKPYKLTRREIYLALAKQVPDPASPTTLIANPNKTWNQVNPALPSDKIEVLGPPPTSGTRDAFVELVMESGCSTFPWIKSLKDVDEGRYKRVCDAIREDGGYVEAGENDNLIVQKLEANPKALGIFGYSFLEENISQLQGATVDGVAPTFDNIASSKYPVSRPLFIYVKKAHIGVIPGLREFVTEYMSDRSMGGEGYLADKGLVPMSAAELAKVRSNVSAT
ncbi:MAG: PstS family phosphate ABC transporter substrate-binding protein, partial [Steroidobacteraceae bacterium]